MTTAQTTKAEAEFDQDEHENQTGQDIETAAEPCKPRKISSLLWALLYAGIFLASQFLSTIVISLAYSLLSVTRKLNDGTLSLATLSGDPVSVLHPVLNSLSAQLPVLTGWILLSSCLISIGVCWFVTKKRGLNPRQSAGLRPAKASLVVAALFLGIGLSLSLNSLMNWPNFDLFYDPETSLAQALLFGSLFTMLVISTLGPLAEEIVFRGFMLSELRRSFTVLPSVLVSSLVFGVLHGTFWWMMMTALLGLLFAWIALRNKSVWPAVAAHIGLNATSSLIAGGLSSSAVEIFILMSLLGLFLSVASTVLIMRDSANCNRLDLTREETCA